MTDEEIVEHLVKHPDDMHSHWMEGKYPFQEIRHRLIDLSDKAGCAIHIKCGMYSALDADGGVDVEFTRRIMEDPGIPETITTWKLCKSAEERREFLMPFVRIVAELREKISLTI